MDYWRYISNGNLPEAGVEVLIASNKDEMYVASYQGEKENYFLVNTCGANGNHKNIYKVYVSEVVSWTELPSFP